MPRVTAPFLICSWTSIGKPLISSSEYLTDFVQPASNRTNKDRTRKTAFFIFKPPLNYFLLIKLLLSHKNNLFLEEGHKAFSLFFPVNNFLKSSSSCQQSLSVCPS